LKRAQLLQIINLFLAYVRTGLLLEDFIKESRIGTARHHEENLTQAGHFSLFQSNLVKLHQLSEILIISATSVELLQFDFHLISLDLRRFEL
jgi:hypothetical protein